MIDDWSRYPNFKESELKCSHCGQCDMHPLMMDTLQSIRDYFDKPIFISSGYRCVNHPVESMKERPGEHANGMAVDIVCNNQDCLKLIELAQKHDINRIGVHQKGRASGRFLHLGVGDKLTQAFPVAIWTY